MRVNRVQFCSVFGCTKSDFDTFVAEGMPAQKAGSGRGAGWAVDTGPAHRWLVERALRLNAASAERSASGSAGVAVEPDSAISNIVDLSTERAKLAREQRVGHELKNATARGELIPSPDVVEGWQAAVARARSLLLGIPVAAAEEMVLLAREGSGAVRERLADMIHAALTELANTEIEDVEDVA